jgi:hypothetical protein
MPIFRPVYTGGAALRIPDVHTHLLTHTNHTHYPLTYTRTRVNTRLHVHTCTLRLDDYPKVLLSSVNHIVPVSVTWANSRKKARAITQIVIYKVLVICLDVMQTQCSRVRVRVLRRITRPLPNTTVRSFLFSLSSCPRDIAYTVHMYTVFL